MLRLFPSTLRVAEGSTCISRSEMDDPLLAKTPFTRIAINHDPKLEQEAGRVSL